MPAVVTFEDRMQRGLIERWLLSTQDHKQCKHRLRSHDKSSYCVMGVALRTLLGEHVLDELEGTACEPPMEFVEDLGLMQEITVTRAWRKKPYTTTGTTTLYEYLLMLNDGGFSFSFISNVLRTFVKKGRW